jgi:hypothetical protein
MIAVRVADELRFVVIASRAYHGRPKTPLDLLSVNQLAALTPHQTTKPAVGWARKGESALRLDEAAADPVFMLAHWRSSG